MDLETHHLSCKFLKMKILFKEKLSLSRKGFTLVELLLVMAIIGILAGMILVGISYSRKRAKTASALETANSIAAELADCYLRDVVVDSSFNGQICSGAGNWPTLTNGCNYGEYSNNILSLNCNDGHDIISCDIVQGGCRVVHQ